ncbi:type II toxin-antitoxin system PemK/MazF family toxin [Planktothrix agardhii]|jgi:mRNA interferase MazF|uniref:type II toxin-antitoxin system PemK/MazF family toxin n=1 Tax=Planktothrix agardhii TaxID=1160 RepID=UPI001D09D16B|nr:type II toxin-antitoxin system PemK/MazF family toxin [Planktothrix agardhii]MCB8760935.1 type II toxin-antitoxin system PemK/MazF family toxin [Planktothrix agardhii 1813]
MLRGQIWLYQADPTVGDEIGKTRPCVIVSNDEIGVLRLKVIVPITGWSDVFAKIPWMVRIEPTSENGLSKLSVADGFQVRSVSEQRLIKQVGTVSEETIQELGLALAVVLNI